MSQPSLSRRRFIAGTAAVISTCTAAGPRPARSANPEFHYRLGLSQPLDSPNFKRLQEMAGSVRDESSGRMEIEVLGAGKLGSDSAMLAMLQKNELEMYLGGNVFGPLLPVMEMPGLPFTFKSSADVFVALDGDLGDYLHAEMLGKGIYTFQHWLDNGFHQLTTRSKPIRTVDDLMEMKIRTPVQTMTVDFFETLGAKPMRFTLNQLYEVLKNETVDGQTDPLGLILLLKLHEVQTYLSLTNHWWSGFTLVANATAWNGLPSEIQAIIEKHAKTAALAQRQDVEKLNASALETLRSRGMIVNETDTSGFKKPLAAFYARWKQNYGDKAWALLEAHVGKLI